MPAVPNALTIQSVAEAQNFKYEVQFSVFLHPYFVMLSAHFGHPERSKGSVFE